MKSLSRVRFLATPWTAACQAPPSMGFSRQEYWSGVPLPSPSVCWGCHIKVLQSRLDSLTKSNLIASSSGGWKSEIVRLAGRQGVVFLQPGGEVPSQPLVLSSAAQSCRASIAFFVTSLNSPCVSVSVSKFTSSYKDTSIGLGSTLT